MAIPKLVLASASPARQKLLQTVGINPIVQPSNIDETVFTNEDSQKLVETLAEKKAKTISNQFSDCLILGCDSVLLLQDEIYGKPADRKEAIARWQKMRGNHGLLYTGHALIDLRQNKTVTRCGITKVYFANISDDTIKAYVATGEPLKCAGGFALEGRGGLFVEKIEGCYSNVIGLSYPILRQMLTDLGYQVTDFW